MNRGNRARVSSRGNPRRAPYGRDDRRRAPRHRLCLRARGRRHAPGNAVGGWRCVRQRCALPRPSTAAVRKDVERQRTARERIRPLHVGRHAAVGEAREALVAEVRLGSPDLAPAPRRPRSVAPSPFRRAIGGSVAPYPRRRPRRSGGSGCGRSCRSGTSPASTGSSTHARSRNRCRARPDTPRRAGELPSGRCRAHARRRTPGCALR